MGPTLESLYFLLPGILKALSPEEGQDALTRPRGSHYVHLKDNRRGTPPARRSPPLAQGRGILSPALTRPPGRPASHRLPSLHSQISQARRPQWVSAAKHWEAECCKGASAR